MYRTEQNDLRHMVYILYNIHIEIYFAPSIFPIYVPWLVRVDQHLLHPSPMTFPYHGSVVPLRSFTLQQSGFRICHKRLCFMFAMATCTKLGYQRQCWCGYLTAGFVRNDVGAGLELLFSQYFLFCSRRWFNWAFFVFIPNHWGNDSIWHNLTHIFHPGWLNHHLVIPGVT